jgi:acid phosphatase (class A)
MKEYFKAVIVLAILILIGFGAHYLGQAGKTRVDGLTFTNTMKWDPSLLAEVSKTAHFIPNFKDQITLPPPPSNSSIETKHEIDTLLTYQKNRTGAQVSTIKDQMLPETIIFGGNTMASYFYPRIYPKTAPLLTDAFADLSIVMFTEKAYFNRVRPSALDPRVQPAIEVPGHPAYPSAHSTQLHFMALFFGELRPSEATSLWTEADAIAKNREIAGVHYPSDSAAGVLLAKQVFTLMMANPEFKKRFDDARSEWR